MDDNHMIRGMLVRQLISLGYDVHATVRGEDAVSAYVLAMETGRHFDVVILDLAIEVGWNGGKTLTELLKRDPTVKAIVCSGSLEGPKEHYEQMGFRGILGKPYSVDDLRREVETALTASVRP